MMKYNAFYRSCEKIRAYDCLIAVNKMSKTLEMSIRCNVYIAFSKLSVGSYFFFRPGPGLDNLRVGAVVGCCSALLRFILFWGNNSKVRHVLICSLNLVNLKGSTIVAHVTNSRNYVKKKNDNKIVHPLLGLNF